MTSPSITQKSKKKTKEEEKSTKKTGDGLCVTCNNEPSCAHNKSRGPAMFCEEYDGYSPPARIEPIPVPGKKKGNGKMKKQFGGLCVNCDHNADCTNAATEGGVWHCEEYR